MAEQTTGTPATAGTPDPEAVTRTLGEIAERSQRIVQEFMERQQGMEGEFQVIDPRSVGRAFTELYTQMMADPARLMENQMRFWQSYSDLWNTAARRMLGETTEPVIAPSPGDRRFKDEDWDENPVFDFIKQSYLLASRYVEDCVAAADGLDDATRQKVDFYARQFVDAMAPTNFASTNPAVVRETVDSGGENLLKGLSNMLEDLERGRGKLRIKMTDLDKFVLGENVAVTPGKVVYQNDLMQLIQYAPTTDKVHRRPLMIIPPWINKYYILDLRPKNSFIRWAVEQGHTVFVLSWVNPDAELAGKTFTDYMNDGPLAALDAIERATGERSVKAIGYCLGGTLLAATLACMAKRKDDRIKCATFFTTMVDFAEPGELGVFIDEEHLGSMERDMEKKGYFEGANMAEAFNLLRANDLIWSFVVNNYLMGKDPFPFDLLYWNSDSTRMPRDMHSFYLRNMYQKNLLCQAGGVSLDGDDVDLRKVKVPTYILSTKEDHIAPWKSTYSATQLYAGPVSFVLGASGHIAGVINPPAANKYGYWTNDDTPADADAWLASATAHEGSWWTHWNEWVGKYNGKSVPARTPGDGDLDVIEDAPGSFVKVRAD